MHLVDEGWLWRYRLEGKFSKLGASFRSVCVAHTRATRSRTRLLQIIASWFWMMFLFSLRLYNQGRACKAATVWNLCNSVFFFFECYPIPMRMSAKFLNHYTCLQITQCLCLSVSLLGEKSTLFKKELVSENWNTPDA